MWGTPSLKNDLSSLAMARVPSFVEPPAPYVTEAKFNPSFDSFFAESLNFETPSPVLGGKNSTLSSKLVPVGLSFVRPAHRYADVVRLLF